MSDATRIKTWLKQARKLIDNGEYEQAIQELDQCLALYPEMYQALVLKGFACHSMNHQEMAVKCFEKATQLEPNNVLAWRGILETLRGSQDPKDWEKLVQALDVLLANNDNQRDPKKEYEWLREKANYLDKLAVVFRQSEKAYESGLLWKRLATWGEPQSCPWDNYLQAFRSFYLAEEIASQEPGSFLTEESCPFSCSWYRWYSVGHQIAIYRCYRGCCEELNNLVTLLSDHFPSIPWTEEDVQKLLWRQKLQLVLQQCLVAQENNDPKQRDTSNCVWNILQQWECFYRHLYSSGRYARPFLELLLECYLDDFLLVGPEDRRRFKMQPYEKAIRSTFQKAIREYPLDNPIAYACCWLLAMMSNSSLHGMRSLYPRIVSLLFVDTGSFTNLKNISKRNNGGGYIICFVIDLIRHIYDSENRFSDSVVSCCTQAIDFIQEMREHRLCSFGQMEYIFRFVRCYYYYYQLLGKKQQDREQTMEEEEDWEWLQKYRHIASWLEQDWQRLEWIKCGKNTKMMDREEERTEQECSTLWMYNQLGIQCWLRDKHTHSAVQYWNRALQQAKDDDLDKQDTFSVFKCFQWIRKALHIDSNREWSRTCCLLAFHYLYTARDLEMAEKLLIRATQKDVDFDLSFALLGFLFEYLSIDEDDNLGASSRSTVYLQRAIKCYQRCLFLSPQHSFASWRLYRLYSKTQQLSMAQQLLEQLTSTATTSPWPHILLGNLQLYLGNLTTKSACSYFQTGLRYVRMKQTTTEATTKEEEEELLTTYLEPLLRDTIGQLQSRCMSSTAWFGLCDAYAAEKRLSAALASCTRGLATLEQTLVENDQESWIAPSQQLQSIYRRQMIYRVKKGHLLSQLNRLEEALEELESIETRVVVASCGSSLIGYWKCTLGQVYFQQAVGLYWSSGLYQRALHTLRKAIDCFSLQNDTMADLALVDRLGIALCTEWYLQMALKVTNSNHDQLSSSLSQAMHPIWKRVVHRYPHHSNVYAYWAFLSLFRNYHQSTSSSSSWLLLVALASKLIRWATTDTRYKETSLASIKHLLYASFTSCLLLAMQPSFDATNRVSHRALALLGKLPAPTNPRSSHWTVSLWFAVLWMSTGEANEVPYAFIQDALRRDPCNDIAWLLLGMWRQSQPSSFSLRESILPCYLEAIRLSCHPLALLGASRVVRDMVLVEEEPPPQKKESSSSSSSNPPWIDHSNENDSWIALGFALAYKTNQFDLQREWLPWLEKMVQRREESVRAIHQEAATKWQILRCIHCMPHLCVQLLPWR